MKLYRHYKQKYYKLLGKAIHSEDLNEYAYYECLYDNPSGQYWIRPAKLFFGTTEVDGQSVRRFEEVQLKVEASTALTPDEINNIIPLYELIFGKWDAQWFDPQANAKKNFYLQKAYLDNQLVGFKLGYEEDGNTFYSWLGGVHPEFRRYGVAQTLMCLQHEWCKNKGYKKVRTKTQNRFKGMLILNLKMGFEVIGTHTSLDQGGLKIMLEKIL